MSSCRRILINKYIASNISFIKGNVLDVGGFKKNKNILMNLPNSQILDCKYLNIDTSTNPDIVATCENIPLKMQSFDSVVMHEVLEALENPKLALIEIHRILKTNGFFMMTVPFLYPIHNDPFDYQRWTSEKLRVTIENIGFEIIDFKALGGGFSVVHDILLHMNIYSTKKSIITKIFSWLLTRSSAWFIKLDSKKIPLNYFATSGYGIICKKI